MVFCIFQDSRGFMWFGTKGGLSRYDGYSFTTFKYNPSDSTSLSQGYPFVIHECRSGVLWIGMNNGIVNLYDPETASFNHLDNLAQIPLDFDRVQVRTIFEESDSVHFVGTAGAGMFRFHGTIGNGKPASGSVAIRRYHHLDDDSTSLPGNNVSLIYRDRAGLIWVGANSLCMFDPRRDSFTPAPSGLAPQTPDVHLWAACEDSEGLLWFGHEDTLKSFDRARGLIRSYGMPHADKGNVLGVQPDREGRIWFTGSGTFTRFDPGRGVADWEFGSSRLPVDKPVVIFSSLVDGTGVVWMGTNGYGVFKYNRRVERFGLIPGPTIAYVSDSAFAYFRSKGRFPPQGDIHPYAHDLLKSLAFQDHTGTIWSYEGNRSERFLAVYTITGESRRIETDLGILKSTFKPYIFEDRLGIFWFGGSVGLASFDPATHAVARYELRESGMKESGGNPSPAAVEMFASIQDSDGTIWIGTITKGLAHFDPLNKTVRFFSNDPRDPSSLSHNYVISILEDPVDPKNYLWVGTDGGGLNRFEKETGRCDRITESDGLPNDVVYGILSDGMGHLWLSTNRGLCRFSPKARTFRTYDVNDGLQGSEFNRREYVQSADGRMYFSGTGGINGFYPAQIADNPHIPPVVFTDFRLRDRPVSFRDSGSVLTRPIGETKEIILPYDETVMSFEFAALDFSNPATNHYSYMLEGFDKTWSKPVTRRSVTYTNLDPGEYTFRVRGSNSDLVWNDEGASIRLIVTPPWWKTWWFRISSAILVVVALGSGIRYLELRRIKERMNKLEHEAAIEKERARISRDMHDDIGSRLTEVSLMSEIAHRSMGDQRATERHLREIAVATREIVDALDEIVWAVNPKYNTLDNMLDYIAQYAGAYLDRAQINCAVDLPEMQAGLPVPSEVRHNVFMVVKEFLNNTVKYARASDVLLRFCLSDGLLQLEMSDNGKGFELTEERKFSDGLANMRKRIEDIGGTCSVDSGQNAGTRLRASVSIGR
jgi:signal transduction histidine kinase/ligand-binding sensor domain-containing protein